MSGQTSQIEFLKIFDLFEDPTRDQFIDIDKLLMSNGIFLKFNVKNFNPINGFFGTPVSSDNYDYRGIEHLLNLSDLFINLNNYTNNYTKDEDPMSSYLIYNKISLNESDFVSISFPQSNEILCSNKTISSLRDEPLNISSSLMKNIIDDKFLLVKILKNKTGMSERNSNINRISNLNDAETFSENCKFFIMNFNNSSKSEQLWNLVNSCFEINALEFSNINYDDKVTLIRSRYCGIRNYIWMKCFWNQILAYSRDSESIDDVNTFLSKVDNRFKSRNEKSRKILDHLTNNIPFEVTINHD